MRILTVLGPILLVLLVSCDFKSTRMPASELSVTPEIVQETFDIPQVSVTNDNVPSWSSIRSSTETRIRDLERVTGTKNFVVELEKATLPPGIGARLEPNVSESGKFTLKILYANDDVQSRALTSAFLSQVADAGVMQTYYDFFEWSYNMKAADVDALSAFHKLKVKSLGELSLDGTAENALVQESFQTRSQDFDNIASSVAREKRLLEKARKDLLSDLDKAGESGQLKRLVAEGKREEVAELINKYLPREQMTPFESKFWDQVLDFMKNPLPMKDRILVFRGIDEDMIYGSIGNAGKELTKEEAVASGKGFMMSSMLTKNQGTWNRRLRSIQTANEKFLGQHNITQSTEWTKNFRISTFFKQHSRNPQGSPFLSFTPKISVANQFGRKRTAAYLIDPRALLANTTTGYTSEFEFLTSLVTFPDELVDIHDINVHGELSGDGRTQRFLEKTKNLLIEEYGQVEGEQAFQKVKSTFDHFNNFSNVAQLESNVKKESFFTKISNFFKKKKTPLPDVPVSQPGGNCSYVLKMLWNL